MDAYDHARLIQQYGDGPNELRAAWEACPPAARQWKPSATAWSAAEIVQRCGDSETFAATRICLLVAEPEPVIVGYDQDAWVGAFGYSALPAEAAFDVIAAVRKSTHDLIARFEGRHWVAIGRHTESGPYRALDWLATYAVHLHDHADQIRANVHDWRARQVEAS